MTQRKPRYCPDCGTRLVTKTFEERDRGFCPDCQEFIYQNPVPVACVVVLDGAKTLFVKRGHQPDKGKWTIPGGILEVDEPPAVGAARELNEETNLRVAPGDLHLIRTDLEVDDPDDGSLLSICFAVERTHTRGTPTVGAEPTAVQFWHPEDLLASDEETRSVDLRRLEASLRRIRNEDRAFTLHQ